MSAALTLVPPATAPAAHTLGEHIQTVEDIASTIEALADEELSEEMRTDMGAALIAALSGTRAKVDRVTSTLSMFEHLSAAAAAECDRLQKRTERYAAHAERLRTYVLAVMDANKLDKLDGETSTLQRRRNPGRVVVDDAMEIPVDFLRFPPELPPPDPEPDKKLIAATLKTGMPVAGCRLEFTHRLVRS